MPRTILYSSTTQITSLNCDVICTTPLQFGNSFFPFLLGTVSSWIVKWNWSAACLSQKVLQSSASGHLLFILCSDWTQGSESTKQSLGKQESPPAGNRTRCTVCCVTCPLKGEVPQSWPGGYPSPQSQQDLWQDWGTPPATRSVTRLGYPPPERTWDQSLGKGLETGLRYSPLPRWWTD